MTSLVDFTNIIGEIDTQLSLYGQQKDAQLRDLRTRFQQQVERLAACDNQVTMLRTRYDQINDAAQKSQQKVTELETSLRSKDQQIAECNLRLQNGAPVTAALRQLTQERGAVMDSLIEFRNRLATLTAQGNQTGQQLDVIEAEQAAAVNAVVRADTQLQQEQNESEDDYIDSATAVTQKRRRSPRLAIKDARKKSNTTV